MGVRSDFGACVRAFILVGIFEVDVWFDFDFVCSECDLRKSSVAMKKCVVFVGGGCLVMEGMCEWVMFGWYEMPVMVVICGACCDVFVPVEFSAIEGLTCDPMGCVFDELVVVVVKDLCVLVVDEVLECYTKIVYCAFRTGSANVFGLF